MAKNAWISVFHNGSKANTNTEQIYWESSSSDDEHLSHNKQKRKKLSEEDNRADLSTRFIESPVLGLRHLELYKLSPELSQRRMSIFVKEPSPVIEKRRVRLKNKGNKSKENRLNGCASPDLFDFEPSQNITSGSPVFNVCSSQATINIEPFPSQLSSQVKPIDIQVKDNNILYYEPPKRKKNYKKGGLAYQLRKALKLKSSRVKIWHHEKVHDIESEFENQEDVIRFKLKKIWNEYGNTMLLGEVISNNVNSHIITEKDSGSVSLLDSVISNTIFLLNIGTSSILNIDWKTNNNFELYPPYNIDRVIYCGQHILYYSNASKFMM